MLRKRRRSEKLFSDFNTLQFASVMSMVVFVLLLAFMTQTTPHHGISVDLPKAWHPTSMPGALREDAMRITITRDEHVFFRSDQVTLSALPERVREHLKDSDTERNVYIAADMRVHWGTVKLVVDSIRSAGVSRVIFLVHQRNL
jgi:biopolymer transport protein ExbD